MDAILAHKSNLTPVMEKVLNVAVDTVNQNRLYTPRAFENGTQVRSILEYSMSDLAAADRETVKERLAAGASLEAAAAEFLTDEYFETWYQDTLAQLKELTG